MRYREKLLFDGLIDAPTFRRDLRETLEQVKLRTAIKPGSVKIELAPPRLRVWLAPITEGRATSRTRWPRASKTAPAPQANPVVSIDHLSELLIEGFCEGGA
jgi:hypothetical protein